MEYAQLRFGMLETMNISRFLMKGTFDWKIGGGNAMLDETMKKYIAEESDES